MDTIPSKKQLDAQRPKFALLPQDDYNLEIAEANKEIQNDKYTGENVEIVNIIFRIISLKDGSRALDEEMKPTDKRKVFFTARPTVIGFNQAGNASITRQFIAYTTGQDLFEELKVDWNDMVGRTVSAEIVQYINQKGVKSNKIGRFLPPRKKSFEEQVKGDDIPVVQDKEHDDFAGEDDIDPKEIPF